MDSHSASSLRLFYFFLLLGIATTVLAEPATLSPNIAPSDRIRTAISDADRVALAGSRHPLAKPVNSVGPVPRGQKMDRMILVLAPDSAQQAALEELIRAQHDPASPQFHQWLTPEEFGERFGASPADIAQITKWLSAQGFQVEDAPTSRRTIVFSGVAGQVESAFHTPIHNYSVNGEMHYANATEVQIPRALSPVVAGVVSLHDFLSSSQMSLILPAYTAVNGTHFLSAADWDTIYDVSPLYSQGIDGTGVSIAVLGRVDIAMSDIEAFRTEMNLPANDPRIIVNGPDPGSSDSGDQAESALDVEWAGAIAKSSTIKFITSKSGASDGISLSAQYAVNNNVAPIISLSYGLCEAASGSGGNAFWNSLWAQAAAQGQSVFVASMDSGAAGCDPADATRATHGRGVNALCSSPYSTCVGGTLFNDSSNPGQYWSAANSSGMASALQYIPEVAWNESGSSNTLYATGGGVSQVYSKPSWQAGPGVPADGMRDLPDISATAAVHDGYVIQIQGMMFLVGGTSASTPAMASVMALVDQKTHSAQGNANPNFYVLANLQQNAGGAAIFHDVTSGNNSVPGVTGFNAGPGYDPVTGLGSTDVNLLVNHWTDAATAGFSLSSSASSLAVVQGNPNSLSVSLVPMPGFTSSAKLSASGAPSGVTVSFSSPTLTAASPVQVTFTASSTAAAGNSTVTISATGTGLTRTTAISLSISAPTFSMALASSALTVSAASSSSVNLTTTAGTGFKSSLTLSVTGLPKGLTASFSPSTIASPGSGSSALTLSAAPTTAAGVYPLTAVAKGGNVTNSRPLAVIVIVPTFTLTLGSSRVNLAQGQSVPVTVTTAAVNGFTAAIVLSASGLPKGVTASFSPVSIPWPGSGSSTLTLRASSSATLGACNVTVIAAGAGITKTILLGVSVTNH